MGADNVDAVAGGVEEDTDEGWDKNAWWVQPTLYHSLTMTPAASQTMALFLQPDTPALVPVCVCVPYTLMPSYCENTTEVEVMVLCLTL